MISKIFFILNSNTIKVLFLFIPNIIMLVSRYRTVNFCVYKTNGNCTKCLKNQPCEVIKMREMRGEVGKKTPKKEMARNFSGDYGIPKPFCATFFGDGGLILIFPKHTQFLYLTTL